MGQTVLEALTSPPTGDRIREREKMIDQPQPPTKVADVTLGQEIRAYIADRKSPVDFVMKSLDRRNLQAYLNAPAF